MSNSTKIFCPINYDQLGSADCQINVASNPDVVKWEEVSAVRLEQNQIGIFRQPGDKPAQVVEGIGYHAVPAKYTMVFPTTVRTLRTERDTKAKCATDMITNGECNTTLDQVRLKGGAQATVDFDIDYKVLVTKESAGKFALQFTSYADFMDKLNRHVRTGFRNQTNIDPALFSTGDINEALAKSYKDWTLKWQFASLIEVSEVRIRSVEIAGVDNSATNVKNVQGEQNAKAFATQEAIACSQYKQEASRVVCMQNFIWSQKQDGSTPPVTSVQPSQPITR